MTKRDKATPWDKTQENLYKIYDTFFLMENGETALALNLIDYKKLSLGWETLPQTTIQPITGLMWIVGKIRIYKKNR